MGLGPRLRGTSWTCTAAASWRRRRTRVTEHRSSSGCDASRTLRASSGEASDAQSDAAVDRLLGIHVLAVDDDANALGMSRRC
jgi:hypothetical protein